MVYHDYYYLIIKASSFFMGMITTVIILIILVIVFAVIMITKYCCYLFYSYYYGYYHAFDMATIIMCIPTCKNSCFTTVLHIHMNLLPPQISTDVVPPRYLPMSSFENQLDSSSCTIATLSSRH